MIFSQIKVFKKLFSDAAYKTITFLSDLLYSFVYNNASIIYADKNKGLTYKSALHSDLQRFLA